MTTAPLMSFDLDRTYAAPPEKVWDAFARADLLERWVCPDPEWLVSSCEVDARAGGGYRIRFGPRPAGDDYRETATYEVFEPVTRLVMDTLTAGEDMSERSRVTVRLLPVEGGTRLELTVDGLSGEAAVEGLRTGWQWCLEGLAGLVDGS
ncbi:SRPBCC family protein [Actinomycetospora sp. CA-084318]|uniref:SRPBCC family protein n=1 Tax=Actinomycetospora sp. CA-084318 TaxID=3239892 RepID=UPI003D97B954